VIKKYTKKMIVALKTTDQRESLDYWLTQYDRYGTDDPYISLGLWMCCKMAIS
jgi:hypothetical protein